MAVNNDDNKKLSKTPGSETGEKDVRYFTIHHSVDGTGSQHYSPFDLDESKEYSFDEWWSSTGGYKTREAHKKGELSTSLKYETRSYNIGGKSQTGETHGQSYFGDTYSISSVGDMGSDAGKNRYVGTKGFHSERSDSKISKRGPGSDSHEFSSASGDRNEDFGANLHRSIKNDSVKTVGKNDITIIKDGDSALHVQSGNYDTHIAQKGRMYSGSDLLIESGSKITLKVGGSTIEITAGGIKMVSPRIDLN